MIYKGGIQIFEFSPYSFSILFIFATLLYFKEYTMKNYLLNVVALMFIIVIALLGLNRLPGMTLFGKELKKVNILSDIEKSRVSLEPDSLNNSLDTIQLLHDVDTANLALVEDSLLNHKDSVIPPSPSESIKIDNITRITKRNCKEGITCIIDYSDSTQRGMYPFYRALDNLSNNEGEYARIAFFGDSFIEADILTADLRNNLQKKYGGAGVGFIPITSEMRFFRKSVRHDFKGWSSYSVTQKPFDKNLLGISGEYSIPTESAYVEYSGQSRYKSLLDTCQVASLFYKVETPLLLSQRINRRRVDSIKLGTTGRLAAYSITDQIGKVRWGVPKDSTALFYGAAMDGETGVILDNFGQRSSSGYSLSLIPYKMLVEFNKVRPYDLIVLEYGLNVVAKKVHNYDYYRKGLTRVIKYLKQCFPNAGFLIVSVGDRDMKDSNGDFRTMPEILDFIETQRDIARENHIAFWNMFEAMGGEDSMVDLVNSKPAKANLDYTHINFIGGRFIAGKLYEALLDGKEKYDKGEIYVGEEL